MKRNGNRTFGKDISTFGDAEMTGGVSWARMSETVELRIVSAREMSGVKAEGGQSGRDGERRAEWATGRKEGRVDDRAEGGQSGRQGGRRAEWTTGRKEGRVDDRAEGGQSGRQGGRRAEWTTGLKGAEWARCFNE
ncbi:hypothetical protein BLNAU_14702 [Blattamonas nauphoetae]|uniref:Uncharacterized protein n=1 Tax=Blattamonas nauphoetae TaxID=2049346 RepID=A0ABQ9XIA7_9EUKA|nr:hypothetical protein BLNAU_14702 [Blattamonas nauphoetae]